MLGLDWNNFMVDDVLAFGVLVLMVLMTASLAVWFACSIVENAMKMGLYVRHSNYEALLRENKCLKDSLVEAQERNDYLRQLYCGLPPRIGDSEQKAA